MLSKEFIEEYINNNKSGKMSVEKYVLNNYPSDYDIIKNNSLDIPFKEKIYCIINNINNIVLCKNTNCKNPVKFKNSTIGYLEYCSNKCVGSDPNIIKRKEEKSLKKFGTKTPAESNLIKNKLIETNNKLYGGNSPMCSHEVKEKSKKTLLENWGVDNPSKNHDIQRKRVESFRENIEEYLKKYKKTSIKRYGVDHPWINKEIHKKSIISGKKTKEKILYNRVINKIKSYSDLELIDIDYDKRNINILCHNCNKIFSIHREYFHNRYKNDNVICTECNPLEKHISGMELTLFNFIKSQGVKVVKKDRKILDGKELDIYLPDHKLAFEFNGIYWHSEINKDKYYHIDKTNLCNERGINLIHIWEDDWKLKKEILKSIIKNKIGKIKNKVYARKCIIKDVSTKDSIEFLNKNHIQGKDKSKIKIGLYYKDEMVSLMTFGKNRNDNETNIYELSRFCNKINLTVIGGSSKLFKYFLKTYKPSKIISYSDDSLFTGNMYEKLNFKMDKKSPINYKWVIGKKREHKSKYRKDRLIKMGYDKNKSEREIMYEDVGSYRIWDCGLTKWIYLDK